MLVLSRTEARALDTRSIELGTPGPVLMENAGQAVVRTVLAHCADEVARGSLVLCGKGNNGGDGFVVARLLLQEGFPVRVMLCARRADLAGDAAVHAARFVEAGGEIQELPDAAEVEAAFAEAAGEYQLVVDALLGTGLSRPPAPHITAAIGCVNAVRGGSERLRVVAVDLPSGLESDTGRAPGAVVRADRTVTFGTLKYAHVLPVARALVGEVEVADIGLDPRALREVEGGVQRIERADVRGLLPRRAEEAHKGDSGHLLLVAGALGTAGAAALAGRAALRAGAGLLTIATTTAVRAEVAANLPEAMTAIYPAWSKEAWHSEAARRSAFVVGPGLGQGASAGRAVDSLLGLAVVPGVVDADGLNLLGQVDRPLRADSAGLVLTPHPGEMARLCGITTAAVQSDRLGTARSLAARAQAVVVLKGSGSLVVGPGGEAWLNPTGGPILAAGGSGDVLAGMIGALLAQGLAPEEAARAAVWWHGAAGDHLAERFGDAGALASELSDELPCVRRLLVR